MAAAAACGASGSSSELIPFGNHRANAVRTMTATERKLQDIVDTFSKTMTQRRNNRAEGDPSLNSNLDVQLQRVLLRMSRSSLSSARDYLITMEAFAPSSCVEEDLSAEEEKKLRDLFYSTVSGSTLGWGEWLLECFWNFVSTVKSVPVSAYSSLNTTANNLINTGSYFISADAPRSLRQAEAQFNFFKMLTQFVAPIFTSTNLAAMAADPAAAACSAGDAILGAAGTVVLVTALRGGIRWWTAGPASKIPPGMQDFIANAKASYNLVRLVGRDKIIDEILDCWENQKKVPILVGGSGTGKTAILMELARRLSIAAQKNSAKSVDMIGGSSALLLLPSEGGQDNKLKEMVEKVVKSQDENPTTILVLDEVHVFWMTKEVKTTAGDYLKSVTDFKTPGYLKYTIAATTEEEFAAYMTGDPAVTRRLQRITIPPLSAEIQAQLLRAEIDQKPAETIEVVDTALAAVAGATGQPATAQVIIQKTLKRKHDALEISPSQEKLNEERAKRRRLQGDLRASVMASADDQIHAISQSVQNSELRIAQLEKDAVAEKERRKLLKEAIESRAKFKQELRFNATVAMGLFSMLQKSETLTIASEKDCIQYVFKLTNFLLSIKLENPQGADAQVQNMSESLLLLIDAILQNMSPSIQKLEKEGSTGAKFYTDLSRVLHGAQLEVEESLRLGSFQCIYEGSSGIFNAPDDVKNQIDDLMRKLLQLCVNRFLLAYHGQVEDIKQRIQKLERRIELEEGQPFKVDIDAPFAQAMVRETIAIGPGHAPNLALLQGAEAGK